MVGRGDLARSLGARPTTEAVRDLVRHECGQLSEALQLPKRLNTFAASPVIFATRDGR